MGEQAIKIHRKLSGSVFGVSFFFFKSQLKERSQYWFIGKLPVSNTFHFLSRFPVSQRQQSL